MIMQFILQWWYIVHEVPWEEGIKNPPCFNLEAPPHYRLKGRETGSRHIRDTIALVGGSTTRKESISLLQKMEYVHVQDLSKLIDVSSIFLCLSQSHK